ncbi:MAG: site-2 protease family protein [Oscillospiraceae bacterium]|jgi:Zn-dependent protease|nr:site-2 protease family protein [Oscillospiraceae bacterium]
MLWSLIRGELSGADLLVDLCASAFVLFVCLPMHEFAHAWMANRLGDETPRLAGRLTLNPLAHLDLFGALLIFLAGFGYAKPVPVNPRNMRCGSKKGLAYTALAGPVSNLIFSFLLLLIANAVYYLAGAGQVQWAYYASLILTAAAQINLSLAVFNLIPLPPLDGYNALQRILPYQYTRFVHQYADYIQWGLIAAVLLGLLDGLIGGISGALFMLFDWLTSLPFVLLGR